MLLSPARPTQQVLYSTPYTLGFLTDYGTSDGYGGLLHAVALSRLTPQALQQTHRMDLSHGVPRHDVGAGRWLLQQSLPYLPPQCVLICVIDPFVGDATQHVALLARPSYQQLFIAPDNGLLDALTPYIPDASFYRLPLKKAMIYGWPYPNLAAEASAGATFHGRDIYTPLGCHFLNGWANGHSFLEGLQLFDDCKTSALSAYSQALPVLQWTSETEVTCHIQHIDSFGNLITTLPHYTLANQPAPHMKLDYKDSTLEVTLYTHYAAGKNDAVFAVRGSHGFVELASFGTPCALPLQVGDAVQLSMLH